MTERTRTDSRIPTFGSIEEEAEFWDTHDSGEFEDEFEPVEFDVSEVRSHYLIEIEFDRATWDRLRAFARSRDLRLADLARTWVLDGYARAVDAEQAADRKGAAR